MKQWIPLAGGGKREYEETQVKGYKIVDTQNDQVQRANIQHED